ncbi:6-phosphogluconolactonase [Acidithiobacillus ferrianus]|uniref:6-phosphogluconolactonase n=2 Tax=Acidithiobacillus ferrianus TaxID=2678518 RepID=A0A845U5G7_9PROT|nr:6-phosphogluconolactonase [Acidithiobacillus ferrianus]NDU41429.1 6-phosphogluconolactonase [Acidithiobacillus ferrianus]
MHAFPQGNTWHIHPDPATLAQRLTVAIARSAREAIATRGGFHLVVAGGGTPQAAYALLPQWGGDWQCWHIYHGDERCLPPEDAERNSLMLEKTWLSKVPIPARQIHHIPAERGAEAAARDYATALPAHAFDLVLLGVGEDGHTASLFPGHDWGMEKGSPATIAILDAAKAPPQRVSLSGWRLRYTREMFFLAAGSGKRPALAAWLRGEALPAATVGTTADIWLDAAAWPGTPPAPV